MVYGENGYYYRAEKDWGQFPPDWDYRTVPGIAVDQQDRVYLLSRGLPPIAVFSKDGKCLEHWGDNIFQRAHGVCPRPDGSVYCVDDAAHAVYLFDRSRKLVFTLGERGRPSNTGCINKKWQTITQSAGPFHYPTNMAIAKSEDLYVTDGYGNARVHCFAPDGTLKFSWGDPGKGTGQFNLPHGIAVGPDDNLYVCDRANDRIQIFTQSGEYVSEWDLFERPADIVFDKDGTAYVAECKHSSVFDDEPCRISIVSSEGRLIARLGGCQPEDTEIGYHTAHGIAIDSEGSLYVAEVGKKIPQDYRGIKKYRRVTSNS